MKLFIGLYTVMTLWSLALLITAPSLLGRALAGAYLAMSGSGLIDSIRDHRRHMARERDDNAPAE